MRTRNGCQVIAHLRSVRNSLDVYAVDGYVNERNTNVLVVFSNGYYRMDDKQTEWDIIKDE